MGYVLATILGIVALLGLGFLLLFYIVCRWERRRTRPLQAADQDRPHLPLSDDLQRVITDAAALQFQALGLYHDGDDGWKRGYVTLLLSPDQRDLLWVQYPPAARFKIITRLDDGHWIITSSLSGEPDYTGLELEEQIPQAPLDVVYYHHESRLAEYTQQSVPFDPATVVQQIAEHLQTRRDALIHSGLARYVDGLHEPWTYTHRGAWTATCHLLTMGAAISDDLKAARQRARELQTLLKRQQMQQT